MESPTKIIGLGQWVKQNRLEMKLSLRGFAEKAGIVHSTLDSVERGGNAREDTLELIVKAISENSPRKRSYEGIMREARAAMAGLEINTSLEAEHFLKLWEGADPVRRRLAEEILSLPGAQPEPES